jgi:hypothetical protein
VISILYSSADAHLEMVRELEHPSIVAVVSISEHFLMMARGLLGSLAGAEHTVVECLFTENETARIPYADFLVCDAIVFACITTVRL